MGWRHKGYCQVFYIIWSTTSLPAFIECPVGHDLPSPTMAGFAGSLGTVHIQGNLGPATASQPTNPSERLCLLSVMFGGPAVQFPYHEDLRGQYTIRPIIRSDYNKPIGVRLLRWVPHAETASVRLETRAVAHGLQIQKSPEERSARKSDWGPLSETV